MHPKRLNLAGVLTVLVVTVLIAGPLTALAKKPPKRPKPPPPPPTNPDPAIAYRDGGTLMVMNADGTNSTTLLVAGDDYQSLSKPDWSPDGTQLVFWSDVDGAGIYVIDVDGTDLTKLVSTTMTTNFGARPVWSPKAVPGEGNDAYRIAFLDQGASGYNDLYLIEPDGSDLVQLTDTALEAENFPTWSPSGTKLAFKWGSDDYRVGDKWGLYDFVADTYIVQQHGGALQGVGVGDPAWSKTQEDMIAWRSQGDIWIVDLDDTANPLQLTDTTSPEEYPSWSPDDTEILFRGATYKGKRLKGHTFEIMSATDGSNRRKIADGDSEPIWMR